MWEEGQDHHGPCPVQGDSDELRSAGGLNVPTGGGHDVPAGAADAEHAGTGAGDDCDVLTASNAAHASQSPVGHQPV